MKTPWDQWVGGRATRAPGSIAGPGVVWFCALAVVHGIRRRAVEGRGVLT